MTINISGFDVLIDDEDLEKINKFKWWLNKKEYEKSGLQYFVCNTHTNGKRHILSLHRYLMNCSLYDKIVIDHIDGNTLDCRKNNLRRCTHAENCRNRKVSTNCSSGYRGVYWHKKDKKWVASIIYNAHAYNLGEYSDILEAVRIYDIASIYFYKEYAKTNLPLDNYKELDYKTIVENALPRKTSIYKGVHWDTHRKHWLAIVRYLDHVYYAGQFLSEVDAAIARDKKAYELMGSKARLNFPIDSILES